MTICTQNRECLFGTIVDNKMQLNDNDDDAVGAGLKPAPTAITTSRHGLPEIVRALNAQALTCAHAGDYSQALIYGQQALAMDPYNPELLLNLGVTLKRLGSYHEAIEAYQQALSLRADDPLLWNNMGTAWLALKEVPAALSAYQRAVSLAPDDAACWNNLGNAYTQQADYIQAIECFLTALQFAPTYCEAHNNLGTAYAHLERYDQAQAVLENLTEQVPDYPKAHRNLARVYAMLGDTAKTVACLKRYLALVPQDEKVFSNLLFYLMALPDSSRSQMNQWTKVWCERFVWPLHQANQIYLQTKDSQRKIRLGYVSADMYNHSACHNFRWLFSDYDREQFEVVAYYNNHHMDSISAQLQAQSTAWHQVVTWSDEQFAQQIRHDQIDILVDLSGHTDGNRLLVFARKAAPLQVTGIGFGQSTGLPLMDYRFSDVWIDPPDQMHMSSEKLIYVPCMMHWDMLPDFERPLPPAPIQQAGHITLGCGNNLFKISETVLALWAEILTRLPHAILHLKSPHTGILSVQAYCRQRFARYGVPPERLRFSGTTSAAEHLDYYGQLDLALDPFPYNGGISTLDALWMGTPVVALAGVTTVGAAMLHYGGIDELIAHTPAEYVELVCQLAHQPERIQQYRQTLRQQFLRSPLTDRHGFVSSIERAYRIIWQKWCHNEAPASFSVRTQSALAHTSPAPNTLNP